MYQKCPKCGFEQADDMQTDVCERCGLVFEKWLKTKYKSRTSLRAKENISESYSLLDEIKPWFLTISAPFPKERFYLNIVIYVGFFTWGWSFIFSNHYSAELNNSFMHIINLTFHEAGHVIFRLLGRFMTILGGSLLQILVPIVFLVAFLKKRDPFAASIMLWWLAQSMMDLVAYIDDAQRQEMWLLGGVQGKDMPGIHDWNNILGQLGMLDYAHGLAVLTSWIAIFLMLLAFYWGAILLLKIKPRI